jgi:hypothetical protein
MNNIRPNDPPIPDYRWVPGKPDPKQHNSTGGCFGCDFRSLNTGIRCSRIPCQTKPGMVAQLVQGAA